MAKVSGKSNWKKEKFVLAHNSKVYSPPQRKEHEAADLIACIVGKQREMDVVHTLFKITAHGLSAHTQCTLDTTQTSNMELHTQGFNSIRMTSVALLSLLPTASEISSHFL